MSLLDAVVQRHILTFCMPYTVALCDFDKLTIFNYVVVLARIISVAPIITLCRCVKYFAIKKTSSNINILLLCHRDYP